MEKVPEAGGRGSATAALVAPMGAFVAIAIAIVALVRRWGDTTTVSGVPPPEAVMAPAAAVGVLLAAGSLLLVRSSHTAAARSAGLLLAGVTTALGLLVLGQFAADWGGITGSRELVAGGGWWAQRPSPITGFGLTFIGASFLALGARRWRIRRLAGPGAGLTLVVALTGLVGHAYGASVLYGLNRWGGTSLSSASALAALALGILFADPSQGVAAVSVSPGAGGHLLRRLTPPALLAPLLLGWLTLAAQGRGLVNAAFGAAVLVVSLIILIVGLVARQAMILHAVETERERLIARERKAREQVTGILESITDAFFAVDQEWRFRYVNREAERLFQRPRDQLLGRNLWEEFSEAIGTTFHREYHRAMAEQTTVQFEEYYPPLDIYVDVRAYPAPERLSVFLRDVTARRRAEEKLRESEERYRLLADMVPQHIWTTDRDGYHNYFSRRWYEFTGMTPGETQGEKWLRLLHPDDRERAVACWQHSIRTGEPYTIEYRVRRADGEYLWFLVQAVPQRNEEGEIIRWFGTLTDISERKRLDEEREQLLRREQEARAEAERRQDEVERVTESRTRLMRGFSHDVKNPLGAADAHAQLLEDGILGALSDRQRESVRRIRRSIHSSLRLINDLLELARAEAGQLQVECVETDVTQAAREVAEDFRPQAAAVGLAIDVDGPEGLCTETDPGRMRQILANLLSNTVKYAPHGRATVTVAIRHDGNGSRPGRWIGVSVSDTGPGIPADKQEVIFQEFTRLDPEAQQGAGVGLAISRRIARLLGGDLTVESEVGRGATFTLWLPPASPN